MMSRDQAEAVKAVYLRLLENEESRWTDLDENLEFFSWLTDKELIIESQIKFINHSESSFWKKEVLDHCFEIMIMDVVEAIVALSKGNGELHVKNRYILTYYLALSEMGEIFKT